MDTKEHVFTDLTKLPKLRKKKFVATINVQPNDGTVQKNDPNEKGHYCFWRVETFNPLSNIAEVRLL